jgi:hypothetical protein
LLTWTTATEINNDYFEVQHATDGNDFTTIGYESGRGNTAEPVDYRYMHYHPPAGLNYYRLRQVDYDESYAYSEIRQLNFNSDERVAISHTLTSSTVDLALTTPHEINGFIAVYSMTGQLMHKRVLNLAAGSHYLNLDVSAFPADMYVIHYYDGQWVQDFKFIRE